MSTFLLLLVAGTAWGQPRPPLPPVPRVPSALRPAPYRLIVPEPARRSGLDFRPTPLALQPPPGAQPAPRPAPQQAPSIGPAFEQRQPSRAARDILGGRQFIVPPAETPPAHNPAPLVRAMESALSASARACQGAGCGAGPRALLESRSAVIPQTATTPGAAAVQITCPTCGSSATAGAVGTRDLRILTTRPGQAPTLSGAGASRQGKMGDLLRDVRTAPPVQFDRTLRTLPTGGGR